jgi:hypothetical protein
MIDIVHGQKLVGRWIREGDRTVPDATCQTIEKLISEGLKQVAEREGGWTVLYRDPHSGDYWELTYPQSEMQGGGPPMLMPLDAEDVQVRYPGLHFA